MQADKVQLDEPVLAARRDAILLGRTFCDWGEAAQRSDTELELERKLETWKVLQGGDDFSSFSHPPANTGMFFKRFRIWSWFWK